MNSKNHFNPQWPQTISAVLHKTIFRHLQLLLSIVFSICITSASAQKTFIKETDVNTIQQYTAPEPTVLEIGQFSYFSISNGSFNQYDPIAAQNQGPFYNYLIRYDLDGNIEKARNLETTHYMIDMAYAKDENEEYLYTLESRDREGYAFAQTTVHKLKAGKTTVGDGIWSKTYIPANYQNPDGNTPIPQSIIPYRTDYSVLSDEGCIVSTYLRDWALNDPNISPTVADYLNIIRLDKDGNIVWRNYIGISSHAASRVRMIQNNNGVYVLYDVGNFNGTTDVYISQLDLTYGTLIQTQQITTVNNDSLHMYDITTNGADLLLCGSEKSNQGIYRGMVLKMDQNLNFVWSQTFNTSPGIGLNNTEIFFRIIHNKDNEYFVGGYFTPYSQTYQTVSSLRITDMGANCLVVSHNYLDPITTFAYGNIIFVDMEHDLACGSVYLTQNNSAVSTLGGLTNNMIRTNQHEFGCLRTTLSDTRYSNLSASSVTLSTFSADYDLYDASLIPKNDPEPIQYNVCQNCGTSPNFNLTIQGNGASNGCVGNKLLAPTCYAYYEWYKDGILYLTTKSNELTVTISGSYYVKACYSPTCYNQSISVSIWATPQPNFTFTDHCEGLMSTFTNTTPVSPTITATLWDFGDGGTSTATSPAYHTYTNAGAYNVKLKVTSNQGCVAEITKTINIYSKPVVNFTQNSLNPPMAICKPSITTWTGTGTANLGQTISNYSWTFNDPNQTGSISGPNITFYFGSLGNHNIVLTATTNMGCVNSKTQVYDVYVPTGSFTQDKVCEGQNITLTANYTSAHGTISSYEWLQNYVSVSTSNPHTIPTAAPASYYYSLFVTDNFGCTSEEYKYVNIYSKPTVSFTNSSKTCQNENIVFTGTASSSGTTITSWDWDFDDGGTASTQNVNYTYVSDYVPGYHPKLTVTDGRGCQNSYTKLLPVYLQPLKPAVSTSSGHDVCSGEVITLLYALIPSTFNILWTSTDPSINNSTNPAPTYTGASTATTMTFQIRSIDPAHGCSNISDPYIVYSHPLNVTINNNSPSNILCPGSSINLSGFIAVPQQFYEWQKSTDNGTTWTTISGATAQMYGATSPGWYRYKASNTFGCVDYSTYINVIAAAALTITNNLPVVDELYPAISPALLSIVTTNAPTYTQIQWYRNDIPIGSGGYSMPLTLPGDYFVIATGCGIEKSNIDAVNFENNAPSWNTSNISGITCTGACSLSSAPGTGYLIDGDITLSGGAIMTIEATINFKGCRKIVVNSGCSLTITNNSVISSKTQWQGIYVASGGTLIMNNNSDITNAVVGVYSKNGGKVNIQSSTFGRNVVHMVFDNYNLITPTASVANNTFGHVIDGPALTCTGFTDYNNLSIPRGNQIFITGTTLSQSISFNANTAWLTQKHAGTDNTWLSAKDNQNLSLTLNMIKGFYNTAIKMQDCKFASLTGNQLTALAELPYAYNCPCGPRGTAILMKNTEQASLTGNVMKAWVNGMEYYENLTSALTTSITSNKFLDGLYGLVIAPVGNPIGFANRVANQAQYSNINRVSITCNLFDNNQIGIVGSGEIPTQGGGTSAGNRFKNGSLLNGYHSILWNANTTPITYNCTSTTGDDYPGSANPTYAITIDGDTRDNNGGTTTSQMIPSTGAGVNSCTIGLSRSKNDKQTSIDNISDISGPKMYPNPASTEVNIDNIKGNGKVSIYNTEGKLIFETQTDQERVTLSLEDLANGLYLIYVSDANGNTVFKLMKVDKN